MAHPTHLKKAIIAEKENGKSLLQISIEQSISYSTIKRIWSKYQKEREQGLVSKYDNCGPKQPRYYRVFRMSVWLKRKHPSWGAPFILTLLREYYPDEKLPHVRTVQQWFRLKGLNPSYNIREQPKAEGVKEVHDWIQIDAKEKIKLEDGGQSCYLTMVEVKSGALLDAPVFPPREYQSGQPFFSKTSTR